MNIVFKQTIRLVALLAIATLLLGAGRIIFYFSISASFDAIADAELFYAILKGFEYDLLTIIYVNSLFIFFFLWPAKIYNSAFYLTFLKILFFIPNSFTLLLNLFDIRFYRLQGHRLRTFEFKGETKLFFNELQTASLNDIVSRYLSLAIYFLIFLIIVWLSLRLIKRRNFELKKGITLCKLTSIALLAFIAAGFVISNFDKANWLTKLYLKTDRRLVPLVVNNPYLMISSFRSDDIELIKDWDIEEYNSTKQYNNLKHQKCEYIKLVVIEKKKLPKPNTDESIVSLSSLNCTSGNILQVLDEVLLSFPGIYNNGFYQSVYSLNSYKSLVEILQKDGYTTKLSVIGYDDKIEKLIGNFYGFPNIFQEKSSDNGKTFELILINAKDKEDNILLANAEMVDANSLTIRLEVVLGEEPRNKNELIKSVSFTTLDTLPFYNKIDSIITQPLDIKPSILHLLGYTRPFTAFGNSLFVGGEKVLLHATSVSLSRILIDSLLLIYSNNETVELKKMNDSEFLKFDFKDSLAVEKIILENRLHSILNNYKLGLKNNSLK